MEQKLYKPVIFTDLDGTLLDFCTYSFESALPALSLIKERNIPLIFCTSKTKKETEFYRSKMGNSHPFIVENGGGIFIPRGYFPYGQNSAHLGVTIENYTAVQLGADYQVLRSALASLRSEGFQVKGFGDMSIEEIAELTCLPPEEAEMARDRHFDEPFTFCGDEEALARAIQAKGLAYTRGNRFFHLMGSSDKGEAVKALCRLFEEHCGPMRAIAVGDSPNDLPMLGEVEYPIVVKQHDGTYAQEFRSEHFIFAEGIGPEGWNSAVLKLLH